MYMKEITTCEVADSVQAFNCQSEEQCDDCFMVDHLKECSGCEHYDHPVKTLVIHPTCECNGTGVFPQEFSNGSDEVECPTHHPAYQKVYTVDELIKHLGKTTGLNI